MRISPKTRYESITYLTRSAVLLAACLVASAVGLTRALAEPQAGQDRWFTVFAQTFVREPGQPAVVEAPFTAPAAGEYALRVESANTGTNASISLNDVVVVTAQDLAAARGGPLKRGVRLQATNRLAVNLGDTPGSSIALSIGAEDLTPPTVSAVVSPAPVARGWNATDVTVTFQCSDAGSGVATCPSPIVLTQEGAGQKVAGTAVDKAGNTRTATAIVNIDKTAPSISGATNPPANAAGWHRSDVRVGFTCQDALAGVGECQMPLGVPRANAGSTDVAGTARDKAGNIASTTVRVNIDATAPTIVATADRPPDVSNWYTAPVTVSFSCDDDRSGIASCPAPVRVAANGEGIVVEGVAVDRAGNGARAKVQVTMRAPATGTAPILTATVSPTPSPSGWNNSDVTVTYACQDSGSGVQSCPPAQTITAEGVHEITVSASDTQGNTRSLALTVRIDRTPPVIAAAAQPPANPAGWHAQPATVSFTCTDALSQVASCSPPVTVGNGTGQTIAGTAVDGAGNVATASLAVNVDTAAPTATAALSALPNAAGWNNAPVTVTFSCADDGAGVEECPPPFTVTSDGADQIVDRVVVDRAGNQATVSTMVRLDRAAPAIALTAPAENAVLNTSPVHVIGTVGDALSGLASVQCGSTPAPVATALDCERALTPGSNTIVVRATDVAGNETTVTRTVQFTPTPDPDPDPDPDPEPNRAPRALPGGPYAGVTGIAVAFDGSASFDPDAHSLTYLWNFGDNTTGIGPLAPHAYASAGTFTVTLTVNDGHGGSHVGSTPVTVTRANTAPVARVGGPYSIDIGTPLVLDATASTDVESDPLTAAWNFGDGGTASGLTPQYTYRAVGTFTATVTISDSHGGVATANTSVTVRAINQPPAASVGGPYRGEVNRPIAFDASASSDPDNDVVSFAWTFGDGAAATGAAPSHTFAATGVFTVTVTATDARGGTSSASTQATVTMANALPTAEANGPYTREEGFAVALSSAGSVDPDGDALAYTWRFGDGRSSTQPSPSPVYMTPGTYTVELVVNDGRGGTATDTATVTIVPRPTQANRDPSAAAGGPYEVEAGRPLVLNGAASIDPDGDTLTFAWAFGDGGTSSDRNPTHAWAEAGSFAVSLSVSDGRGGSATATTQITVTAAADRAPPVVTLRGAAQVLPGTQVLVSAQIADASPIPSVQFQLPDGSTVVDAEPPFERSIEIPAVAAPGASLIVRATAVDTAGNAGIGEIALTIAAQPDGEPPTVVLHRPAQLTPGQSLHLSADAADNAGVSAVAFFVNGVEVASDSTQPFAATYLVPADTAVGSLIHVAARAIDFTGNDAEADGDVAVVEAPDDVPPVVSLSAPAIVRPGSTFQASATASDNRGISSVQLLVDDVPVSSLTAPPYQLDVDVPLSAASGSLIRVQARAVDFAGLETATATAVRVEALTSDDEGLVLGEVYDETTGTPVAGAHVRLSGQSTSGSPFVVESETDSRGAYAIRAPEGTGAITVSRPGWTESYRSIAIAAGQAHLAIDARIGALTNPQTISPVLGGTVIAGDSRIIVAPGAVAQPLALRARRLSAQGLRAPLPIGWAPIAAIDLVPSNVALTAAATWQAPLPAGLAAGRALHLASWDEATASWIAVSSQVAPDSGALSVDLTRTGQYVWVAGDIEPVAPPAPAAGAALPGVPSSSLPADAAAALTPQPRVIVYEPGVRSDVTTEIPSAQPLSSGARLHAVIEESYSFTDNSALQLDPYTQDVFFHQSPGNARRLRAVYPVSPSLQVEPLALREGVIQIDVNEAPSTSASPVITASGGMVEGEGASRLEIPAGAVQQLASASLEPLAADEIGLPLPTDVAFIGGAMVSLSTTLGAPARLSVPRPAGLDGSLPILLVRAVDVAGVSRLVLAALGRVEGDRVVTRLELPLNGVALPGIREAGRYAFVSMTTGAAFAFGRVLGVAGPAFADALLTSDTLAIASRSGPDGAYVSAVRVAPGVVTALDIARSDSGSAPVAPAASGDEVAADVRLQAAPPHVTSVSPANGASDVPPTTPVTVRFSEPLDPASVSATALTIEGAGGFAAGTVSLSDGNTVLTFRPIGELANDTEYTVRVAEVRDRSGNALPAPFIARFSSVDTTAPPPPAAGVIAASIPQAGFSTVIGTQGTAGAHDTVTILNLTRGTITPVLLDPNGGFNVRVAASVGDRLQIAITDRSGNRTVVAAPPFRQANADGSISTAVTAEGGPVEGPGGVAVEVPRGAFPQGTVITLKPVSEAQFPVSLTPEQRQLFRYSGGIDIDLGGQTPASYLDVSIPTTGGETLDDQWIVGQVVHLNGQVFLDAADTARVINGRIRTSSPPCPGVTGSGVYGFLRSARPLGVTYAGIPNPNSQLSGQLLVAAIVPMTLVPGTLRSPITMPAVAGAAIAMAEAVLAEFLNQSRRVCMPLLSGKVTISPNTIPIELVAEELEGLVEIRFLNATQAKLQSFFPPFDTTITVDAFRGSDTVRFEGIDWLGATRTLSANGAVREYVHVNVTSTVLSTDDVRIEVKNLTRGNSWSSFISSSASRPLGKVATLLEGAGADQYRVDVTDVAGVVRTVAFTVAPYPVGNGNLVVRAQPGSVDPTQAQIDDYNANVPPDQRIQGSPVVSVELVKPNGLPETILDAASGNTDRVVGGAFLYAFDGLPNQRYSVRMSYANGRVEIVDIPTFQISVRYGPSGNTVKEIIGQTPPRNEPLQIDLGVGGAPATLLTGPGGFFHVESQTPIAFSFSQALDTASVATYLKLMVADANGNPMQVSGSWQLSNGNRTVTFVPTWPLQMGKTYHAVMNGVTAGGQPVSVAPVPIKTFAPVKLSTTTVPHPNPAFGPGLPLSDVEMVKQQFSSGVVDTSLVVSSSFMDGFKLHLFDVTDPRVPVKTGQTSGGMPKRLSVVPRHVPNAFDVLYDVPLIPQLTGMSCWAASAAMLVAFRDQVPVHPKDIVFAAAHPGISGGYWADYEDGIKFATTDLARLASVWGLTTEPAASWSIAALRDKLKTYGPLWVGGSHGVGAHVRVITGIVGDGTPEGTYVAINNPLDRNKDTFREPNSGSQYLERFTEFIHKQETLVRRLYGDQTEVANSCIQGNDEACNIIATPELLDRLNECNAGDQAACARFNLPGGFTTVIAHLSTLPSHATPGPADPGLRLRGGAYDFTGPPPPAERITQLGNCNANVSPDPNPIRDPVFTGDLLATPYYNSFGSGINFFDVSDPAAPCILGGRPLSRNPETVSPSGGADVSAHGTIKQHGVARGVAILPTETGLEAYVSVQELGLMAVNVGADIPSVAPAARQVGPVHPGDYVDVSAHGEYLLALNNNFGGVPSLDVVTASFAPVSSVTFEAARGGYSKVHQLAVARNVTVRRLLPNGQMGQVTMTLAFVAGANGITIIDATDVEAPAVIGMVPTPGIIRTLALAKDGKLLFAGGDSGPNTGATQLYLIDVTSPFTPYLLDFDSDQKDDRILFVAPYVPATNGDVEGIEYDYARGLLYVASTRALDIWAITRSAAMAYNSPPVANAGASITVDPDITVSLNGLLSHDPDGDPLSYQWQQIAGPVVTLTGAATGQPTFSTQGLSNVAVSFALRVSDATSTSPPDTVTITVRRKAALTLTPTIAALAIVPGTRQLTATFSDVAGTLTDVTAHADTTYQWLGAGLIEHVDGVPNVTNILNQLSAKLGIPVQLANISVSAAGLLTVQTAGIQIVRATHVVNGETFRSGLTVVLAGIELDEISLKPESAITTLAGAVAAAVGSDKNPPLVLGAAASGYILGTGIVVLHDVTFKFAGAGSIGVGDLLNAIRPAIAAALNTLAPGGGTVLTPVMLGAFRTLAGVAGTQLLDPVESTEPLVATVTNQAPFKGLVTAHAPGLASIKGTLDLGDLGSADDSVMTWVLPAIDSVTVEPNLTALRETDPPSPGPAVRMYAQSTAIATAAVPLSGKAQTAAELLDRFLPDGLASWSAAIDRTFVVDTPVPGLKFRIRGGVAPSCSGPDSSGEMSCSLNFANVGLGFPVPNVFAPLVTAGYSLGNPSIVQMGAAEMFDTHVVHRGVAGHSSLTGTVSIPGLGSATDPTARVVVGRGAVIEKRPVTAVTAAPPGSVIDFVITVSNPFPDRLAGISVVDTFYLRPAGATTDTVLSTQTFSVGTLQPGETRTFTTAVTIPAGPGEVRNEASSSGSVSSIVIITIDASAAPASRPLINEIVADPVRDWNDSGGGGDGVAFTSVPGTNVDPHPSVDAADGWFELRTNTGTLTEIAGWTLSFAGASSAPVTMTLSAANVLTQVGSPYVIVIPPSGISTSGAVTLSDHTGQVVDTVDLPAVEAALGPATGVPDEAVARVPDGAPGSGVSRFGRRPASFRGVNP